MSRDSSTGTIGEEGGSVTYRYVLPPQPDRDWLRDALRWRGNRVASLIPRDASAVLKLRHPAYRSSEPGGAEPLSWAEAVPGARVRPESQFGDLVADLDYDNGPRGPGSVWQVGPAKGTLPPELSVALAAALPSVAAWRFAVWSGFASISPFADPASLLDLGDRSYHLLEGDATDPGRSLSPSDWRAPNLWWSADRSWWVHTDVDRSDTFVAASRPLVDRLLDDLRPYECFAVHPNDPLYAVTPA